jgi:hypothetical protein
VQGWRGAALALSLLSARCGPSPMLLPVASATPSDAPGEPSGSAASSERAAPDPLLDSLSRQVSALRGPWLGPLPELVSLPEPELLRRALEELRRELPVAVQRAQAHLLWRLGLVPADFEWLPALELALRGRLEALYVSEPARLLVNRALTGRARRRAIAHELVHALQDQRHALSRRLRYAPDGWDAAGALHTLAEGDALAVVAALSLQESPESEASAAWNTRSELAEETPGVVSRSLAAPYEDGLSVVEGLLSSGGFAAVEARFVDPPASSHELLHPERHAAAGPALGRLPLPVAPGPGWQLTYTDVLGEQAWRGVLEQWLPRSEARELAADWAADRVSCFEQEGATALRWELRSSAPARALGERVCAGLGLRAAEWACGAHPEGGVVAVLVRGTRLVFASLSSRGGSEASCRELQSWLAAD